MPKKIDLPELIKELDAAPENSFYNTNMKLPVGLARDLALLANRRGTTLFAQIRESLEQAVGVSFSGVAIRFDPTTHDYLGRTAEHLGLSRENLVATMVSNHLNEYMVRGLAEIKQRKALGEEMAREAEFSAPPSDPTTRPSKPSKARK